MTQPNASEPLSLRLLRDVMTIGHGPRLSDGRLCVCVVHENARAALASQPEPLDAHAILDPRGLRLYGLDVRQIKHAIDIADLYHPRWREERATRLSEEHR